MCSGIRRVWKKKGRERERENFQMLVVSDLIKNEIQNSERDETYRVSLFALTCVSVHLVNTFPTIPTWICCTVVRVDLAVHTLKPRRTYTLISI